jgi:hypothetical protein
MSLLVFWVVTMCLLVGSFRRFGGAYCLHLQGLSRPTSSHGVTTQKTNIDTSEYCLKMTVFWVVAPLVEVYRRSSSWWWRQQAPLKRRWTSTRLHSATTQKTAIFIIAAVRTSSLTACCLFTSMAPILIFGTYKCSDRTHLRCWRYRLLNNLYKFA